MSEEDEVEDIDRSYVRIRISKDNKDLWQRFCQQKKITLTEFLIRAGNLMVTRPELWDKPSIDQQTSLGHEFEEKLFTMLKNVENIVLEEKDTQKERLDELRFKLGELSQREMIAEKEQVKQILKNIVLSRLRKHPMTLKEIRESIPDSYLQPHLIPEKGKALSILDLALTDLQKEGSISYHNKRYSSSDDSF